MKKKYLILFLIMYPFAGIFPYKFNSSLPVELLYFNAETQTGSVLLTFGTATETNNYGFNIERADSSKNWFVIDFVQGSGTSSSPKDYSFADTTIIANGHYFYRLNQIDIDGSSKYSEEKDVYVSFITSIEKEINILKDFVLFQNYPNPFNPSTSINYRVPAYSFVSLKIYDILGNQIITLVNQNQPSGDYSVLFDTGLLKTNFESGVYFYRLMIDRYSLAKKMIYLK